MQDIYNNIPERKQVSRVYNIAAILYLGLTLPVMLFTVLNNIIILVHLYAGYLLSYI
jgi:hypothetical protein